MCLKPGTKTEQCTGCGLLFSSTKAGDAHRVGRHGVDRRCLSVEEMVYRKVEGGSLEGEPFFVIKYDKAGCVVWAANTGQNPRSSIPGHFTEGRAAASRHSVPGNGSKPSVTRLHREAAGAGIHGDHAPGSPGLAPAAEANVPQGVS